MDWTEIALICTGIALIFVVVAWIATSLKTKKDDKNKVGGYEITNGVRYTKDDKALNEKGETNITLNYGDIMLERGKEYRVGEKADLLPGKYTLLSCNENIKAINMRIGGIVKEYKHFSSIVLTDGDKISALSANAILR